MRKAEVPVTRFACPVGGGRAQLRATYVVPGKLGGWICRTSRGRSQLRRLRSCHVGCGRPVQATDFAIRWATRARKRKRPRGVCCNFSSQIRPGSRKRTASRRGRRTRRAGCPSQRSTPCLSPVIRAARHGDPTVPRRRARPGPCGVGATASLPRRRRRFFLLRCQVSLDRWPTSTP